MPLRNALYNQLNRVCPCDISRVLHISVGRLRHLKMPSDVECRVLSLSDLEQLAISPQWSMDSSFIDDFRCYEFVGVAVLVKGLIRGVSFYVGPDVVPRHNSGGHKFNGIGLQLPPESKFVFKVYVAPEFRGRQLLALMVIFAGQQLAQNGVRTLVTTTDWTNTAYLMSMRRLGFQFGSLAIEIVIAGKHLYWMPKAFNPQNVNALQSSAGELVHFRRSIQEK